MRDHCRVHRCDLQNGSVVLRWPMTPASFFHYLMTPKFSWSFRLYAVGINLASGTLLDPGDAVVKEKTVPILTEIRVQQ